MFVSADEKRCLMSRFDPMPPPFSCSPEAVRAFTPLDIHFAAYIRRAARHFLAHRPPAAREDDPPAREYPDDEAAALAAALACRSRRLGHIRLDLKNPLPATLIPGENAAETALEDLLSPLPNPAVWAEQLRRSGVAGEPGEAFPLILDEDHHLYLWRYHRYERELAAFIRTAASAPPAAVDPDHLDSAMGRLFPPPPVSGYSVTGEHPEEDRQAMAARAAAARRFLVISGGPGAGKTHAVAAILSLLMELEDLRPGRIALAAPTGKAAARLTASIRSAAKRLDSPMADRIPSGAVTLHRLLGARPDSPQCRYHADHPLPADLVVVDEASMVDLSLMARLTAAIRPGTRLILLGDRYQLASVEAGAVLADICDTRTPAVARGVVELTRNYRFGSDSGIGRLAHCVTCGDADGAVRLLFETGTPDCRLLPAGGLTEHLVQAARNIVIPEILHPLRETRGGTGAMNPMPETDTPAERLARLDRFRILCALREGPLGVTAVNGLMEKILVREGAIPPPDADGWYAGRPVLVLRNDYPSGLFNGDTGLTVKIPGENGRLAVCFPDGNGGIRMIPVSRMPARETVFAMTIHKSQGSEFDRVLMILPDRDSPVLTRELLYTGVTRAARRLEIRTEAEMLRRAVKRPVQRNSGLRQAIEGGDRMRR